MDFRKIIHNFIIPKKTSHYLIRVTVIAISAWLFFSYLCIPIHIKGASMEPAYRDDGWNFIWRPAYLFSGPKRSDVVGVRFAGRSVMLLKRVVALEEEKVEFRKGELYVNGKKVDEPYLQYRGKWNLPPRVVKKGNIYVVGDKRDMPMRNHTFGQTSVNRVLGVPIF